MFDDLFIGGPYVRAQMRKYRVTIRELAQRTGLTMKRIRAIRHRGTGAYSAVDILQAIRGLDDLDSQLRAMFRQARAAEAVAKGWAA